MNLPKVFKFKLSEGTIGSEFTYRAEYSNELPREYAYGNEVGKKGYIVSWFEEDRLVSVTYLEEVARDAVNDGHWIIVNDTNEKEKK